MKTALVLMTLLGCDCDASQCEFVDTVDAGWTSVEACRADIGGEVAARGGVYPTLIASCDRQVWPAVASNETPAGQNARPATQAPASPVSHLGLGYLHRRVDQVVDLGVSASSYATAWLGDAIGVLSE